ncbi:MULTISPECIES: hypothetical protein [unclassified Nostoc]|nr:hypothetical protein [Nostoc sp. S13]MDF5740346.1 hypothetical protein [Nostoc sp. S13]
MSDVLNSVDNSTALHLGCDRSPVKAKSVILVGDLCDRSSSN